jgi:hypothetical protein
MRLQEFGLYASVSAGFNQSAGPALDYSGMQIDVPSTLYGIFITQLNYWSGGAGEQRYWFSTVNLLSIAKTDKMTDVAKFGPVPPLAILYEGRTQVDPKVDGRPRTTASVPTAGYGSGQIPLEHRFFVPGGHNFHWVIDTDNTGFTGDIAWLEIPHGA